MHSAGGTSPRRRWRVRVAAGVVGVPAVGSIWLSVGTASAATNSVAVSVNAGQNVATVGSGLVGANVALWDGLLADPQTSTLLKNASTSFVRYPGGSYGDIYHWQSSAVRQRHEGRRPHHQGRRRAHHARLLA